MLTDEERYAYDEVGNIDSVTHLPDGAWGGLANTTTTQEATDSLARRFRGTLSPPLRTVSPAQTYVLSGGAGVG